MRTILLLAMATLLPGCLTTIGERHEITCAESGQYFEGFTVTGKREGSNVGHVRCRTPENKREQCYADEYSKLASVAAAHNSTAKGRNVVIVIGYGLYIVPGYLAKSYWEDENEASVKNYVELEMKTKETCEQMAAH